MERLKELIEKEELTLEEALLGKLPAGSEYGTPETWKLHLYASIWTRQEERSGKRKREEALSQAQQWVATLQLAILGHVGTWRITAEGLLAVSSRRGRRRGGLFPQGVDMYRR
ncbi:hypothetical protein [Pyrobaculum arsenaticum]|uniref:Uncharacterized protein n=1 Tax=Pyrobaculum arsenaticum TaxID=121277 RepID=A0A7L4P7H1_9CREN|nr:hypothetical protein [Pyrobaculum arsenaticum]NYR14467.1 hypothetical protein [Pyrobaculum arsenaticum]